MMPPPADPTTGEALSEEERAELTQALRRAPNAAYLRLPGPVDIAGTFEPYLASAVEAILARRVASAVEEGADGGDSVCQAAAHGEVPAAPPVGPHATGPKAENPYCMRCSKHLGLAFHETNEHDEAKERADLHDAFDAIVSPSPPDDSAVGKAGE